MLGVSLSSGKRRVAMQGDPAGTRPEQGLGRVSFKEGKGVSRGDAACFSAVTVWMGWVSMILLDNCRVHNGKR